MKVGVIGGGAAGFFAAIQVRENYPGSKVAILEKSNNKVLAKVRISGGGRCNVTNGTNSLKDLYTSYPRGEKVLKKLFKTWNNKHTMEWFESKDVPLKIESDNRVFPTSDSSESIIDCLDKECKRLSIQIKLKHDIKDISLQSDGVDLTLRNGDLISFDKIIIATGGSPKSSGFDWLKSLGHQIVEPVPSLFTFNLPKDNITTLQGLVAHDTLVKIEGLKYNSEGPLLITHWGLSGPAILRLSSLAARDLYDRDYVFTTKVNWIGISNEHEVYQILADIAEDHPQKLIQNVKPFDLANRLWQHLITKAGIPKDKVWSELGKKGVHKLVRVLCQDNYSVRGKTTFKEEFVTCGGIDLASVDTKTMRSKVSDHIYFAGEVLNIDGITGGFNFQAAWTTAYIAAQLG